MQTQYAKRRYGKPRWVLKKTKRNAKTCAETTLEYNTANVSWLGGIFGNLQIRIRNKIQLKTPPQNLIWYQNSIWRYPTKNWHTTNNVSRRYFVELLQNGEILTDLARPPHSYALTMRATKTSLVPPIGDSTSYNLRRSSLRYIHL